MLRICYLRKSNSFRRIGLLTINCKNCSFQPKTQKLNYNSKSITPIGWILLTIPVTTLGLGCWQVKRKMWKENLIKELQESVRAEPVHLPENLDVLSAMEYQPVILRGHFLHNKEIYLGPRSCIHPDGTETQGGLFSHKYESGYYVITPFKLTEREETVLINRGWVPRTQLNPENRKNGQIEGEIEIIGIVRKGEKRPPFTPEHKGTTYLYRDLEKMCKETGADPIFFDAKYETTVPEGPIGGQTRITLRNEHLSYIITWFSLSTATALLWYRQFIRGIK